MICDSVLAETFNESHFQTKKNFFLKNFLIGRCKLEDPLNQDVAGTILYYFELFGHKKKKNPESKKKWV